VAAVSRAYQIVRDFEETIADYAGAPYAVAVESCSSALFLSCLYRNVGLTTIPRRTYPSVPCSIINAGGRVRFEESAWQGIYELKPYQIFDAALRFKRGMYEPNGGILCLSFHIKKHLSIGRGGMILTDDTEAYEWFKRMRFDGRDELPLGEGDLSVIGWNMYMQPEDAARGLLLFDLIKDKDLSDLDATAQGYPDLSRYPVYDATGDLSLRRATMNDADLLLKWKNDDETRRNSIVSREPIKRENHLFWLERTLQDRSVELYIICYNGLFVGDLRLNHHDDGTEVSIRLDKIQRGQGLARRAIGMAHGEKLYAKIVPHNVASMRAFLANGYKPVKFVKEPVEHYIFRR